MRNGKKVFSHDSGLWLTCCWHDCEKQGVTLYMVVDRHHQEEEVRFVFCSERHKQYWLNSHVSMGNLPVGMKGMIG